jgi:hypothetical protein
LTFIPARHCADYCSAADGRRLRSQAVRRRLVLFPISGMGLVQDHEFVGRSLLGSCILVLLSVFRTRRRERLLAGEDGLVQFA